MLTNKTVPFLFVLIIALVKCRPQVQNIEYQPNRPSFHPSPGSVLGQIVPPGKPWPAGPEGYANFSQTPAPVDVANRWTGDNSSSSTTAPVQNNVQPGSRPSFAWRPHDRLPQLVPSSGSLWPASPEGYANFSQTPPPMNVADRWSGGNSSSSNITSTSTTETSITSIGNRPFFASKPHDRLPQIVPAGAPWPANAEGYANFTQIPNNNRENHTTTSRILVNDLVNIVNLTHPLAPKETTVTEATVTKTTPRITTYKGTVPSTVVTKVEEVTSSVDDDEEVTSTEAATTTEATGHRVQQVATVAANVASVETTVASVVLETTSGVASQKPTTLGVESDAPVTTEAASKETSTPQAASHPSTEPNLGQLFTSSILESNHEQHVPHETSTQAAVTKLPDAQEATNEQVPQQVVAPQYPQIGLFIETSSVTTTTEKNRLPEPNQQPTLEASNKPCFYPIEVVPAQKEPSLVLVPPKPAPEVYAPSKFNDFGTTIQEILTEIDRVTQQVPSRGQAGGPFTIPGFDFDFTKESYFGPSATNPDYLPPSWFPGWIPGYNLVPSKQHHHHRYHYYKK